MCCTTRIIIFRIVQTTKILQITILTTELLAKLSICNVDLHEKNVKLEKTVGK